MFLILGLTAQDYGGGPFTSENNFTSTIKENTIYLFVYNKSMKQVESEMARSDIEKISDYNGKGLKYNTIEKIKS